MKSVIHNVKDNKAKLNILQVQQVSILLLINLQIIFLIHCFTLKMLGKNLQYSFLELSWIRDYMI